MDEQFFYLLKDVGVPTFFVGILLLVLKAIFTKGLEVISKNTEAIRELKTLVQIMSGKLKIEIK